MEDCTYKTSARAQRLSTPTALAHTRLARQTARNYASERDGREGGEGARSAAMQARSMPQSSVV
jgi:hypothetical protein